MDVRRQLNMMLLCAAIVLLSVILRVDGHGGVLLPYTEGPPLPGSCVLRSVFGVDCPTCGLTRSFIALADGEFARAFAFHRLGPLLFIFQDRIGFGRFFEILLGFGIAGIAVGVIFHGDLAIRFLDLISGCALLNP